MGIHICSHSCVAYPCIVPQVLFDELQKRMSEVESKLTPEQKEQLKRGFKHFGY